jgi:hypothetical protein
MTSKECHFSQQVLALFFKNALHQMSGTHAKIEEIDLVSVLNKLFSLDVNGPTPELVFTLVLTTLIMLLPH